MKNSSFSSVVRILDPIAFEMASGAPPPPKFGRGDVPVTVWPSLSFDRQRGRRPVLQLTLHLCPDVAPASAAFEVLKLINAPDHYERGMGGHGIIWDTAHSEPAPEQGVMCLVLIARSTSGAIPRFEALKNAINEAVSTDSVTTQAFPSSAGVFAKREAVLLVTVA